jgi:hypothetical protein
VRLWASHYLFLVLMVCNLRQDTFILIISFRSVALDKSLHL